MHQRISDLQNGNKPKSLRTEIGISFLNEKGLKIVSSHLERQTLVIWIWCRSRAVFETIKKMYEWNELKGILSDIIVWLADIRTHTSEMINSTLIKTDGDQFKKRVGKSL